MNEVEKLRMLADEVKAKQQETAVAHEALTRANAAIGAARAAEWKAQGAFNDYVRSLTGNPMHEFISAWNEPGTVVAELK